MTPKTFEKKPIIPGQCFRNYKDLCFSLGIEPHLKGKSKQLQLKKIEKYIDYKKNGQSFLIEDVYTKPLAFSKPINSEQEYIRNLYFNYIQLILMQTLVNEKHNGKICSTKIGLLKELGMVNNHYSSKDYEKKIFQQYMELKNIRRDYYNVKKLLHDRLCQMLNRAIVSLEKQEIILQKEEIRVFQKNRKSRLAMDNEITIINKIEYNTMKKLGIKNILEPYISKNKLFYKNISEELEKIGWYYYRREHKIIFNEKVRIKLLPDDILLQQKKMLNLNIQKCLENFPYSSNIFYNSALTEQDFSLIKQVINEKLVEI